MSCGRSSAADLAASFALDERRPAVPDEASHPVPLERLVGGVDQGSHRVGIVGVEDRAALREHVDVVDELADLAKVRLIDVDPGPARGQHDRQLLADR